MADPTKNLAGMNLKTLAVSWGGKSTGWTEDVDFSGMKLITIEKKVVEIGDIKVDDAIVGIEGELKTKHHQVDEDLLRYLTPWAGSSGSYALSPTVMYQSCYALSKLLKFHPNGNGSSETEDLNFLKAFPRIVIPGPSDGKKYRSLDCTWTFYPDQAQLIGDPPVPVWGYRGAVPA